ncbi:uncharacterized protein EV420DRAFT_1520096, partial [Desarmillaria tabescens]
MPRKSQVDLISISGIVSAQAQQELVTEGLDNFELPKSLVTSIARSALPDNCEAAQGHDPCPRQGLDGVHQPPSWNASIPRNQTTNPDPHT